ncbi:MAG TPA: Gfo/Idh/MocA family oxidoreductase [Bryobacteraceae bacterium]|jgi:myo-inositol 2-dehydrogenase/D-chiro-inositol 1-dehydrogenase|nr:Gfo/Idh/MocA family oxidoreductase [Bryobacteraceae bacterium]
MKPLRVAVAGLGRMGAVHLFHAGELERENGLFELTAVAEADKERARHALAESGRDVPVFDSVEALADARICDATIVATPTGSHREHATALVRAGQRILLEKPLTGDLNADREFARELDRDYPDAVMIAFQRRFDAPLRHARSLMQSGMIGRVFKIYSALEDSAPAPNGYNSPGILSDMSIHNVDEILFLTGRMPVAALAVGSRLHSFRLTTCREDFDDAMLHLWFEDHLAAQVQVSRNHVSGYRVETAIFGERGQIQIGHFQQKPVEVTIRCYGPREEREPLEDRTFAMREYNRPLPEFVDRFGPAYKDEIAAFVDCCRSQTPFPVNHRDGLRAQEVIAAGMDAVLTSDQAKRLKPTTAG